MRETKKENAGVISVIVPVYNGERHLKRCLDSLLMQTYKRLEIICVDDGSTDHSLEILRFYERKDQRIKVFTQENRGPSAARNLALDHASGNYVSFVDADDYMQWNAYQILAEVAVQEDAWDIIFFGGNLVGEEIGWLRDKLTTGFRIYRNCNPGNVIFREKAARPFLWMHFLKRELLEKPTKLRFDESMKLGEDQIFQFAYIPRARNVITIEDKLYNYRVSQNGSLMQSYNHRRIAKTECHFAIVEKVIVQWRREGWYETYRDELWTWIVNFLYFTLCEFPAVLKRKYGERFFALLEENGMEEYLVAEWEQGHVLEMREWTLYTGSGEAELARLRDKIEGEKREILETMKSRAFRAGRILTPAARRLDLDSLMEGVEE